VFHRRQAVDVLFGRGLCELGIWGGKKRRRREIDFSAEGEGERDLHILSVLGMILVPSTFRRAEKGGLILLTRKRGGGGMTKPILVKVSRNVGLGGKGRGLRYILAKGKGKKIKAERLMGSDEQNADLSRGKRKERAFT